MKWNTVKKVKQVALHIFIEYISMMLLGGKKAGHKKSSHLHKED